MSINILSTVLDNKLIFEISNKKYDNLKKKKMHNLNSVLAMSKHCEINFACMHSMDQCDRQTAD